jgi:WhiB family redox-sensing transcriptional regulator
MNSSDVSNGMETSWMAQGNCNNHPPSVFFPSDGVGVEAAKKICASCPVKEPCLEHALEQRVDHGVWGGASERQRRRILKSRRMAARAESNGEEPAEIDIYTLR